MRLQSHCPQQDHSIQSSIRKNPGTIYNLQNYVHQNSTAGVSQSKNMSMQNKQTNVH